MLNLSLDKRTKNTLFPEKSYEKIVQKKDPGNDENFVLLSKWNNYGNCRAGTICRNKRRTQHTEGEIPMIKIVTTPENVICKMARKGQESISWGTVGRIYGGI
jgi:hypothetical protein